MAINQLIDMGIVRKIQSSEDKRFYFLQLTKKGNYIMDMHKQIHKDTIKKILKILTREEVQDFVNIVKRSHYPNYTNIHY